MAIYGSALLAICLLVGLAIGQTIGYLMGLDKNVGGQGIAMLLLIFMCSWLQKRDRLQPPTESGILFWSAVYIPIVVAMAASQNVIAAVRGGPIAVVAGIGSVVACFALVPLISKIGADHQSAVPDQGSGDSDAESNQ